jgi:RNA polymerase sigma-70 factor (ECF subfamily)
LELIFGQALASELPELLPESVDEIHPGELLAQQEDRQQLWQLARQCLTENQFQALWLRYAEDMDVSQIAQVLGKTRVHVKVLLYRARQILGRHLHPAPTLAQAVSETKLQWHKSNPAGGTPRAARRGWLAARASPPI